MPRTKKPARQQKQKRVIVPMDEELYDEAQKYAEANHTKVPAIVRAMLRWLIGRGDYQELPPGIETEEEARNNRRQYRQDYEE